MTWWCACCSPEGEAAEVPRENVLMDLRGLGLDHQLCLLPRLVQAPRSSMDECTRGVETCATVPQVPSADPSMTAVIPAMVEWTGVSSVLSITDVSVTLLYTSLQAHQKKKKKTAVRRVGGCVFCCLVVCIWVFCRNCSLCAGGDNLQVRRWRGSLGSRSPRIPILQQPRSVS